MSIPVPTLSTFPLSIRYPPPTPPTLPPPLIGEGKSSHGKATNSSTLL